jgi:hypothetical protein
MRTPASKNALAIAAPMLACGGSPEPDTNTPLAATVLDGADVPVRQGGGLREHVLPAVPRQRGQAVLHVGRERGDVLEAEQAAKTANGDA